MGERKQIAHYNDGVGTSSFKPMAIIGGAFGYGTKRIVVELYTFLCRHYEDDDNIYAFGFSRGVFRDSYACRVDCGSGIGESQH